MSELDRNDEWNEQMSKELNDYLASRGQSEPVPQPPAEPAAQPPKKVRVANMILSQFADTADMTPDELRREFSKIHED